MLDSIRESLFNIIGTEVIDKNVIDCFSGSGAVGLEALSRGATHVTLFEAHPHVLKITKQNIELCKAESESTLITSKLPTALKKITTKVDVAFLDPPFGDPIGLKTLEALSESELLNENSLVIYRYPESDEKLAESMGTLQQVDHRIYGRSQLSFFHKKG